MALAERVFNSAAVMAEAIFRMRKRGSKLVLRKMVYVRERKTKQVGRE
jgi:hypothetical protein